MIHHAYLLQGLVDRHPYLRFHAALHLLPSLMAESTHQGYGSEPRCLILKLCWGQDRVAWKCEKRSLGLAAAGSTASCCQHNGPCFVVDRVLSHNALREVSQKIGSGNFRHGGSYNQDSDSSLGSIIWNLGVPLANLEPDLVLLLLSGREIA